MTREELEFSISQYHDGTLPPLERDRVDEILATSAEARAILSDFRSLDAVLRTAPSGLPSLNWDKVQASFSRAIDESVEAPEIRTYRIGRAGMWAGGTILAAAAAVAIFVSVSWQTGVENATSPTIAANSGRLMIGVGPSGAAAVASGAPSLGQISVRSDNSSGSAPTAPPAIAQISIGPSPQVASSAWRYDDALLVRPSRVAIAAGGEPAQDGSGQMPY